MNRIFFALPILALTTGCVEVPLALLAVDAMSNNDDGYSNEEYDDYDYEDEYYDNDDFQDYSDFEQVEVDAEMAGRLPGAGTFDVRVADAVVYTDGSSLIDFEVHAYDTGWAMIGGVIDLEELPVGDHQTLPVDDFIGCSGPEQYTFDFDDSPESVDVTRNDLDGDFTELVISAEFGSAGAVTTVIVVPTPADG